MSKLQHFVSSVVSRLADAIEFSEAALNASNDVQARHLSKIIDQEEKMEMRVARALGVEYRAMIEQRLDLDFVPDAEREVARRQRFRRREIEQRKRERHAAIEMREEAFA